VKPQRFHHGMGRPPEPRVRIEPRNRTFGSEGRGSPPELLPAVELLWVPVGKKAIQAIIDNYATHKHLKVYQRLAQHPHWMFHFIPPQHPGPTRSKTSSPSSRASASSAACFDLLLICRSPSTESLPRQTSIPNLSSEPQTQNACSPLSNAESKR
jgi:hypothetical protein